MVDVVKLRRNAASSSRQVKTKRNAHGNIHGTAGFTHQFHCHGGPSLAKFINEIKMQLAPMACFFFALGRKDDPHR